MELLEKDIASIPYLEGSLRYAINSNDSAKYVHIQVYKAFKARLDAIVKRHQYIANELELELKIPDCLDF